MIEGVSLLPPPISGIAIGRRTPPPRDQIADTLLDYLPDDP
jgi:hypothetical protein